MGIQPTSAGQPSRSHDRRQGLDPGTVDEGPPGGGYKVQATETEVNSSSAC